MNKINYFLKKMNLFFFFTILTFAQFIKSDDESWMKEIEFDGVLLKINERIFEQIMKKINYALVLFYEDKDKKSIEAQDQLRLAAELIVQMSPAVGVFKMKCSENPKFCSELKKNEIPFMIWINNNNLGIYKEPMERDHFINFCEKMTKFSSILSLDSKEDIAEFLMNTNYYRLLGVFPDNKNSSYFENIFENMIPSSLLSNSGEFIFAKITRKELIDNIYQKFDKTQNSLLIFTKEDLLNFTNIFKISEEQLQSYTSKYNFINEVSNEKFFPYYLNSTDQHYYEKNENIVNDIVLNSLPSFFPLDQKFYNLAFGGPIQRHFLLVLHPEHLFNFQILDNYHNISLKFREKKYEIWFTFSIFDNELKDILKPELMEIQKDEEKDFPILLLFNLKNNAENKKEDVEKYFFNKAITFENLERFYLKFHKVSKFEEIKGTILSEPILSEDSDFERFKKSEKIDIPRVVGLNFKELVFEFPDNVLVLFIDDDKENLNLYRKWIFLLNNVLKMSNPDLLRIYKYNAQLNDNYLTQVPNDFPALKLYVRHSKDNPIEYTFGPSILNMAKFLNEYIPLLNLKVSLEQVQAYNLEIFSNSDYIESQIFSFDDEGNQHLVDENFDESKASNTEEILRQRGLDHKNFGQGKNESFSLNETLTKFVNSEQTKTVNKEKYDL